MYIYYFFCSVDHVSLQEQERIKVEFTHEELYAFYNQVSFCHWLQAECVKYKTIWRNSILFLTIFFYSYLLNTNLLGFHWYYQTMVWFRFMVFNTTFNNISAISWQSILLVEETRENHWPVASHWQTLLDNVVSSTPHHEQVQTHNFSGDRHQIMKFSAALKAYITREVTSK
jgi:signal transduction histidine kinase